jgi:AAA ATPase domain
VHAALALRYLIAEGTRPDRGEPRLVVRLALHWGAVIVDLHHHNPAAQLVAVGETLAVPVRLLGQAASGEILASGELGPLLEGWCALQGREVSLGPGSSERIRAHTLVGLVPKPPPLEAHGRPLSRFAGRTRELATLEERWAQARGGHGQVVGIVGEPGVGKSHLVYEFTRALRPDDGRLLESHAASYTQATPYRPVVGLLKTYFQIEDRDEVHTLRETITRQLSAFGAVQESSVPALLTLLEVPVEDPLLARPRASPAPTAHPRGRQADPHTGEPGGALAGRVRRCTLD